MAEKQASRDADDEAIRSGRKSVEQVAEENEAFARALARMGRLDLEAALQVEIDPHDRLVI